MPTQPPPLQRRQYVIFIDRPPEAVFAFHASLKNHARLCPPEQQEEIVGDADARLSQGARVTFRARHGGLRHTLVAEITEWDPPHGFTDRQVKGPFAVWVHRHKFAPFQTGTLMTDLIEYAVPAGPLGLLVERLWLGEHLDRFFNHRQAEAKRLLEQIGRIRGRDEKANRPDPGGSLSEAA